MELSLHYVHQFLPLLQIPGPIIFFHSSKHSEIAPALFDSFKDVHLLMMTLISLSNSFSGVVLVA